ncbi:MAG: NUDIX hydrolase [Coprothermobacterota bacterium]|nr:NUDIX hydrolase [Coprothermobacterota bacterium]
MEKRLKQNMIYQGNVLSLEKVEVLLASGRKTEREIVHHPGAVAILAINEKGEILLERQYRSALKESTWEIPAGKLEPNESPLKCAQRELLEETGYEAAQWQHLHSIYTSPGFTDEVVHLFLAEKLLLRKANPEFDEEITIRFFRQSDWEPYFCTKEIVDGKTLLAFYTWKCHAR